MCLVNHKFPKDENADFKITYRYKARVAYVVAHELAHQWFGNLVTMDWWSELWLNEGFATWVGWLAVDHLYPDYMVWTQFVTEAVQTAQQLDSLRASHPIEVGGTWLIAQRLPENEILIPDSRTGTSQRCSGD